MLIQASSRAGNVVQAGYVGTYATPYPYPAPYGLVDTNSSFYGIVVTENSTWGVVTPFQHFTIDHTAGQAEIPPYGNDINDHGTAEAGYTGLDFEDRQIKYADGALSDVYRVNIDIQQAVAVPVVGDWPFSVAIPSIPVTWGWGNRHPMTQARVRMFKKGGL